jgi:hypothetical protein
MDGLTLLQEARTAGLDVQVRDGRLVIRGPRRAEPIARRLLDHKGLVMDALAERDAGAMTPDQLPADWHLLWDERAAIREYDGGLPRERAEALALAEIIALMRRGQS